MGDRFKGFKRWIFAGAVLLVLALLISAAFVLALRHPQQRARPQGPVSDLRPAAGAGLRQGRVLGAACPKDPPSRGAAGDRPADVFFVHPTTFDGGRDWNGAIDQPKAQRFLSRVVLPNYAGPFYRVGRVFAPRYRQASLYTYPDPARRRPRRPALRLWRRARGLPDLYRPLQQRPAVHHRRGGAGRRSWPRGCCARRSPPAVAQGRLVAAYLIETIVPRPTHMATRPSRPAWSGRDRLRGRLGLARKATSSVSRT
jgi:hypothetical protein